MALLAGIFVEPALSGLGSNQPSVSGLTLTVIRHCPKSEDIAGRGPG
jgi:hypothetical protein